jgi:hypothetical protein
MSFLTVDCLRDFAFGRSHEINLNDVNEIIFPELLKEETSNSHILKSNPSSYISKSGVTYFQNSKDYCWWRNLRFGVIDIIVNYTNKTVICKTVTKNNKTLTELYISGDKIIFRDCKHNVYLQGFRVLNRFIATIDRLDYRSTTPILMSAVRHDFKNNFEKALCEIFGDTNIFKIYHPLVEKINDVDIYNSINVGINSKNKIWGILKTTTRLKDLTYIIFQTRGNKYTKIVQELLQHRKYGTLLSVCYRLVNWFGVKKETIADNLHYIFDSYDSFVSGDKYWRNLSYMVSKFHLEKDWDYLLDSLYIIKSLSKCINFRKHRKEFKKHNLSMREVHDILSIVHTRNTNCVYYKLPQYPELETTLESGWKVVIPKTTHDLINWGNYNCFCIGSYDRKVAYGQSLILGLFKDKQLICAEFNQIDFYESPQDLLNLHSTSRLKLGQIKGKYNKQVDNVIISELINWVSNKQHLTLKQPDNIDDLFLFKNDNHDDINLLLLDILNTRFIGVNQAEVV